MVGPSWNLNSGLSDSKVSGTWTLELAQPQPQLCHFLAVCPLMRHLTSLALISERKELLRVTLNTVVMRIQ